MRTAFAAVLAAFLFSCTSIVAPIDISASDEAIAEQAHTGEPTVDKPLAGCIADSPLPARQIKGGEEGRVLPELVRIIGEYRTAEGRMLMVIRGYYDREACRKDIHDRSRCDWQPWPERKIQIHGCGPLADAFGIDVSRQ